MLELQSVTENRPGASPAEPRRLSLVARTDPGRRALEAFVRRGFARTHGAAVNSFMPLLAGLGDARGSIRAVAGYRCAAHEQLYLEQYLDLPIERVIASHRPPLSVERSHVAEIGNFVCRDGESAHAMIAALARLLREREHRWVVFTATRAVRAMLHRLGIAVTEVGRAEAARVAGGTDDWGRYYGADPRVMLGYVPGYRSNGRFPPY